MGKMTKTQVENVIKLIDEGNTIPFIARYRKEMTGSLDDQVLMFNIIFFIMKKH